ncbi:MAG TPA: hypothetical protein PK154_01105 [Methanoregulaceae archaeon]|nr:hypothetical protein [Methanoregulaceae archaeon]
MNTVRSTSEDTSGGHMYDRCQRSSPALQEPRRQPTHLTHY